MFQDKPSEQLATQSANPLALRGHLAYLEIPAPPPILSANFYNAVVNWHRQIEPTRAAFNDPAGNLINIWQFIPRFP